MAQINWKTRGWKVARATVAALVSVWVLYVIAINVFLSTSLFDRVVNNDPITLDIHYASGWSIWPTTIHAKNLSIRSSDSNVEWLLKVDDITFDTSLLAIPRRKFQVNMARGQGVSFVARQKATRWPDDAGDLSNLPQIAGFPAFNVAPAGPHHPELWDDKQYFLITASMEDTIAKDVREIWINNVRFSGHADLSGRFYLKPLREVSIGPLHIDIHSGQVNQGFARPIATDVAGSLDIQADRFDPRSVHDSEALRYFNIGTDLRAKSVAIADLPWEMPAGIYADGIIDAKKIGIHIVHGHLATGTNIEADISRLHVARDGYMADGALALRASVDDELEGPRLRAETGYSEINVVRADGREMMKANRAAFRADSAALDLASKEPFKDIHLAAEVVDAKIADARVANCILPCTVRVTSGSAVMNARLEAWPDEKTLAATARITYENVHGSMPALEGGGSGSVDASFGRFRWDTNMMEGVELVGAFHDTTMTAATLPIHHGKMNDGHLGLHIERLDITDPLKALDATIAIPKGSDVDFELALDDKSTLHGAGLLGFLGHITLVDHDVKGFDGTVNVGDATIDDGLRFQAAKIEMLSKAPGDISVDATIDGGRLTDGAVLSRLLPKTKLALAGEGGTFHGRVKLASANGVTRGKVDIETHQLGIRGPLMSAVGDAKIAIDLRKLDKRSISLGPSKVEITNAHGTVGGEDTWVAQQILVDGVAKEIDRKTWDLETVDAHVKLAGLEVPDASKLQPLLAADSKLKIRSGDIVAAGEVAFSGHSTASGQIGIDAKHAGITLEKSTLDGDLAFRTMVNGIDANAESMDISGTRLALREIAVTNAAAETQHWFGDVVLDKSTFGWVDGTPSIAADIDLKTRDAKPVVGMLLRDHLPKILAGLATMPNLQLTGHIDAEPGQVLLRDVHASGGDVAFRGSYAVVDDRKTGAFIVEKGPISVGIRLGDNGAHPKFFGLNSWLADEEKKVKAAPTKPVPQRP